MLKAKDYILFLILEALTVPLVITIFKTIEPKKVAAVLAGTVFVSLGTFIVLRTYKTKKSVTLYASFLHLFFFSIPMLEKRIYYWSRDFDEISFYGLSGTSFHKVSETAFMILLAASLIDLLRLKLKGSA